ncbi:MAG: AAA domain-containing protein [Myxococcota bacterium]
MDSEHRIRDLGLPSATVGLVDGAAAAIAAEYQQNNQWVTLRCHGVHRIRGTLWRLDAPDLSAMHWTWEGAMALAPLDPQDFDPQAPDSWSWRGSVVAVDDNRGRLFVDVGVGGEPPEPGAFLVRPFAFLDSLHRLFNDDRYTALRPMLASALSATTGETTGHALPAEGLARLRRASGCAWGVLWGPPGTGKTWTIGRQVAALWPSRRILVVSTTNRATDGAALSIARALRERHPGLSLERRVVRVGSGADLDRFVPERLVSLLVGGEVGLRRTLSNLKQRLARAVVAEERAELNAAIQQTRSALEGCSKEVFLTESCTVVVTTAFNALRQLTDPDLLSLFEAGRAPFDLVIIDEAGLVCRAAAAALSLLAARQVLLVGDPRQLAPIVKMNRLLPDQQATWLSESGLAHLDAAGAQPGVCMLTTQYRMHPEIRGVVSAYQYDGRLRDGAGVDAEPLISGMPRAAWFVLDDSDLPLADIRASRGRGGRSWQRRGSQALLYQLLRAHPQLAAHSLLFITPFTAQARLMDAWITGQGLKNWSASTVHSQQGAEADVVIFDTVQAGLAAWPPGEWRRLINVGMSRARSHLLVVASRAEMDAPWLTPLRELLMPCALQPGYPSPRWRLLCPDDAVALPGASAPDAASLGNRLAALKTARPVLSAEQQQLALAPLDGGPRVVRGVAGSGKTLVMAQWLARMLAESPQVQPIWVVYGNNALRPLLVDRITSAWSALRPGQALPWRRVKLWHIRALLRGLLPPGARRMADGYDYDELSGMFLEQQPEPQPRCAVMFIDEAQDFGPQTLKLLISLVAPPEPGRYDWRPVMIFYDHDQNLYRRPVPRWMDLGLDVQGRISVLREAYRSTRPILELAMNVLYRLRPPQRDPDHRRLLREGRLRPGHRLHRRWWDTLLTEINGPLPELFRFTDRGQELGAIGQMIHRWIREEGVMPGDIRVLSNTPEIRHRLLMGLRGPIRALGGDVQHTTGQALPTDPRTLLITTAHSYKGHDAEIVVIPGVDRFATRGGPLANALYVAMTRARSMLVMSGLATPELPAGEQVMDAVHHAASGLRAPPKVAAVGAELPQATLVRELGEQHLTWLATLWSRHAIRWAPLLDEQGRPIARPLFWFRDDQGPVAVFASDTLTSPDAQRLRDAGVRLLPIGGAL